MAKMKYWAFSAVTVIAGLAVLVAGLFQISNRFSIPMEHMLAYTFILTGMSVFYFGVLRPEWFTKQIVPIATPVKVKVNPNGKPEKKLIYKFSLKDDSYFWKVFPYGLFFTVGGFAYLMQPSPYSILVAFGCAAWVQVLYKYV